jgi:crossover junction endodeoxyribonuclease RuvC
MGHVSQKIILGIDPGSRITGYGFVVEEAGELRCLDFGILQGSPKAPLTERLLSIGLGLEKLILKYLPDAIAIEKTFFAKNVDSVTKLGHARGVCLYEAARAKVPIFEYSPTEIKLNIVGHGRAGKDQVQMLVRQLLGLKSALMSTFDMSDALALAIHHSRISATLKKMKERELTR